jgi:hypothetical protein
MVTDVDALKLKRDQLNARIQKAEARLKTDQKKVIAALLPCIAF